MLFAAVSVAILPVAAQSAWEMDSAHSAAHFQVKHMMITNVRGEFGNMSGKVMFDGKDYSTVKAEAVIQVASINTRVPKRDEHLRSSDFFDAANHPTITFKSKRVQNIKGNKFQLVGDLTMRGVTKELVLDVEATPIVKGMNKELRIGALATTKLNRQDFGVKYNRVLEAGGLAVGNEVQVELDLAFIQPQTSAGK
ncbi:MAG: YceI family protein [Acidobacteria bacterium]|nr:YceI family protein [Acidobacteriota bacterium]